MKKNKGFTLIELLVVIAIIGILASVVLASLNSARNKGADSAVKANLANARAQAEIFYDSNNNTYTNVCNNGGVASGNSSISGIYSNVLAATKAVGLNPPNTTFTTAQTATIAVCHANATNWAAAVTLKDNSGGVTNYYCVDNNGLAIQTTTILGASDVTCN